MGTQLRIPFPVPDFRSTPRKDFARCDVGSETGVDEERWVRFDTLEEEQILNAIGGEYIPPDKRNLRFIMGQARPKGGRVVMKNPWPSGYP